MTTSTFWPKYVRVSPDPVFPDVERHLLLCSVGQIPRDLPGEPRDPLGRSSRSERWRASLGRRGSRRITLTASSVRALALDEIQIEFRSGDGIVEGRQLYRALVEAAADLPDDRPDDPLGASVVEFEVLTGPSRPLAWDLARCLARPLPQPPHGAPVGPIGPSAAWGVAP